MLIWLPLSYSINAYGFRRWSNTSGRLDRLSLTGVKLLPSSGPPAPPPPPLCKVLTALPPGKDFSERSNPVRLSRLVFRRGMWPGPADSSPADPVLPPSLFRRLRRNQNANRPSAPTPDSDPMTAPAIRPGEVPSDDSTVGWDSGMASTVSTTTFPPTVTVWIDVTGVCVVEEEEEEDDDVAFARVDVDEDIVCKVTSISK